MAKKQVAKGPGGVEIKTLDPSFRYNEAIQLWIGQPKVGKTSTFAALKAVAKDYDIKEVKPFLMLFERGSGGVEVDCTQEPCDCGGKKSCPDCGGLGVKRKVLTTPEEVDEWFEWAAKTDFNPIGIDTGDAMFQVIADGVCARLGIPDPTASDHGIAWVQIYDEFREKLGILTGAGKGVSILMHIYMQERRVKGGTIQTATFNVSGKSRPYLAGLANQILHFRVIPDGDTDKHVISTRPEAGIEAGDHWGVFPEELDRGGSPQEAAKAILGCFYDFED